MEARGRKPHLGEAAWRELLARFDRGGESVQAFCAREGVSRSTFNRWRSLGITSKATTTTMPKVTPLTAGFVDLGALRAGASESSQLELTLDLGGGITLHVRRG